ncbi:hypothetical protein [Lujinxingia litoralis]|nr:hypothetical protein [Lujinxingia litoralis]
MSDTKITRALMALLTAATVTGATLGGAWACSFAMTYDVMAILEEEPTEPVDLPPAVSLEVGALKRSATPQRQGCSEMATSCDDTAWLTLNVEGYDSQKGGLRFEIRGEYPETLVLPASALVLTENEEHVTFLWGDLDTMYEPIDAEITATWVDAWGREGETSAPVSVRNEGADGGGCAVGGAVGGGGMPALGWVLAGTAAALMAGRRRRVGALAR